MICHYCKENKPPCAFNTLKGTSVCFDCEPDYNHACRKHGKEPIRDKFNRIKNIKAVSLVLDKFKGRLMEVREQDQTTYRNPQYEKDYAEKSSK